MAAASLNSDTLIAAILRQARLKPDPLAWLQEKHAAALEAVMNGDEFVTTTSDEGGSATSERGIPAATLLQIYEIAIQRYEAEEAAGTTASITGGTDFSQSYTRV